MRVIFPASGHRPIPPPPDGQSRRPPDGPGPWWGGGARVTAQVDKIATFGKPCAALVRVGCPPTPFPGGGLATESFNSREQTVSLARKYRGAFSIAKLMGREGQAVWHFT